VIIFCPLLFVFFPSSSFFVFFAVVAEMLVTCESVVRCGIKKGDDTDATELFIAARSVFSPHVP
jgi:hypothetical protein